MILKKRFVTIQGIGSLLDEVWVNYANGSSIYREDIDKIKPIALDDEILFRCFGKKINGYGYKFFGNWIQKQDNIFWFNINSAFMELKYIHQLQNLYFALTEKEPEIAL